MKIIRGRADARWLPSRHNFALFRLMAYARMLSAKPEPADVILIADRHQSAFESFTVAIWSTLTLACFIAATLFAAWPLSLAIAAAVPTAAVVLEIATHVVAVGVGPFTRDEHRLAVQSFTVMLFLIIAAGWLATRTSWVRFAAWQFLAAVALNGIAAVIAFLLRERMVQMESAFGGSSSED